MDCHYHIWEKYINKIQVDIEDKNKSLESKQITHGLTKARLSSDTSTYGPGAFFRRYVCRKRYIMRHVSISQRLTPKDPLHVIHSYPK